MPNDGIDKPNESKNIAKILETLDDLTARISNLEKFVDINDANTRDKIAEISLVAKSLKTLIYGSGELRFKGLVDRVETTEKLLAELMADRKSDLDKFKGIKIGLGLTAVTGVGTLATLVSQIFG